MNGKSSWFVSLSLSVLEASNQTFVSLSKWYHVTMISMRLKYYATSVPCGTGVVSQMIFFVIFFIDSTQQQFTACAQV